MNLIPHWPWWPHLRRDRSAPPDAADMGTAFGLDASFDAPDVPPDPLQGPPGARRLSPHTGLPRPE